MARRSDSRRRPGSRRALRAGPLSSGWPASWNVRWLSSQEVSFSGRQVCWRSIEVRLLALPAIGHESRWSLTDTVLFDDYDQTTEGTPGAEPRPWRSRQPASPLAAGRALRPAGRG